MDSIEIRTAVLNLIRRRRKEQAGCCAIRLAGGWKTASASVNAGLEKLGVDASLFDWNENGVWAVGVWYDPGEWARGDTSLSTSACLDEADREQVSAWLKQSGLGELVDTAAVSEQDILRALGPALVDEAGEEDMYLVAERLIQQAGLDYVYYTNEKKYTFPTAQSGN